MQAVEINCRMTSPLTLPKPPIGLTPPSTQARIVTSRQLSPYAAFAELMRS